MVDAFDYQNNRMTITKNDNVVFDSDAKSVQLFPDSTKIRLTGKQIVFPNLLQANAYHRYSGGIIGGLTYCESWSTLLWQEWGPTEVFLNYESFGGALGASTRNLPQEYLGSVPADTDYLDVRVRLARTHVPAVLWDMSAPYVMFQEGAEINLPGGSCPTESFPPMLFRHFDIVRDGTSVYLRRYQSVGNKGTGDYVMPSGGAIISSDSSVSGGWTIGAEGAGVGDRAPAQGAWLARRIDTRGPDSSGGKRRNGTSPGTDNQCYIPGKSISYPDLSSTYTGDITIHPGRYE